MSVRARAHHLSDIKNVKIFVKMILLVSDYSHAVEDHTGVLAFHLKDISVFFYQQQDSKILKFKMNQPLNLRM